MTWYQHLFIFILVFLASIGVLATYFVVSGQYKQMAMDTAHEGYKLGYSQGKQETLDKVSNMQINRELAMCIKKEFDRETELANNN